MRNTDNSPSYRLADRFISRAVNSLSFFLGVKNVTRPLWNRWKASLLDEATIMGFLESIDSFDSWPKQAEAIILREREELDALISEGLSAEAHIARCRKLSYLAHMAQWGIIPVSDAKRNCYTVSRDAYIEAETLASGDRFQRVPVPWGEASCWGNLHLPHGPGPHPIVIIVHGMDDTKEEHLSHELACQQAGMAVLCFDGPGQAESLLLEGTHWRQDFHRAVSRAIDRLADYGCDTQRVGAVGVSWGGLWVYKLAAADPRVQAIYDLGGPVHADGFGRLPYFLKSKFCQVLGHEDPESAGDDLKRDFTLLAKDEAAVRCSVRIAHGGRDPLVPLSDKQALKDRLSKQHPNSQVSLLAIPDGDHCCTNAASQVRDDIKDYFLRQLTQDATVQPAAPGVGL